jgi:hypothetical protein
MQVVLNIPDELPQEMISKLLMQFENQLQTAKQLGTKKEKLAPKFGSVKGLIKATSEFDNPLEFSESKKYPLKAMLAELAAINGIEPIEIEIPARTNRANPFLDEDL